MRLSGARLVVEAGARTSVTAVDGSSLRALATAAGADIDTDFDAGDDTPPLGDVDEPLAADHSAALALGEWFVFGWRAIDAVVADAPDPSRLQLWPEHFDAGVDVAIGTAEGARANLGASPGDEGHEEPYLYGGPWASERPGDAEYWNAPFGAVLGHGCLRAERDPHAAAVAFLRRGLDLLTG